jgi:pyrimidine operon attenuation protein/uracil phosphoribosyltransferase
MLLKDLLTEDLYRSLSVPGDLSVAVNSHETKHRSSDRESITTATPLPLRVVTSKTRGVPVYYAYNYLHSEETTEILKSIKGKGSLKVSSVQMENFFTDTAKYLVTGLKQRKIKPDIIVCPVSSSTIVKEFALRIAKLLDTKVITDAFLKQKAFRLPEDKVEALKLIADKFIDHDFVAIKYHGDEAMEFTNKIAQTIYGSIKKSGTLELKGIYKQFGKFVKGFMDKIADVEYEIMDKEVLVFDDVLSSGSTMSEIIRLVKDECLAKIVNGVVIFNQTTSPSKS